jgi:anaerobic selenocysteine-containing dehydrogenase
VRLTVPEHLRPDAGGRFPTPSGRIDLAGDLPPEHLPAAEGPRGDPDLRARFPLVLLTPKTHTRFLNSSYSALPGHGDREDGPHVELDPADAAARGIADGDRVRVANDRGALTLTARVGDRLRPGVVAVPFGWWGDHHGEAATANTLTNDTITDRGGGVAFADTLVEVSPLPPGGCR